MELVREQERPPLLVASVVMLLLMGMTYILMSTQHGTVDQTNRAYWDMARASGFIAYETLAVTVLCGLLGSLLSPGVRIKRDLTALHQFTALLVVPFLCMHVWALHEDTTIPYPWWRIIIPFSSTYKPVFTAFGTLTVYALATIVLSSVFKRRIGNRAWRTIHALWFVMFVGVTLHGIFVGSDASAPWSVWLYVVPCVLFLTLIAFRMFRWLQQG